MSAIMSPNGRKIAKIMHKAAKKFDWAATVFLTSNSVILPQVTSFRI